jgi:O-antigen ligase
VAHKAKFFKAEAVPYWALITFLILTFFTGGASRADVQSLIILRPAAVIFCGIGLWSLRWKHVKAYKFLFGMAAAIFALVLIHLIPLPPSFWGALPGRRIITEIDRVAELGEVWRPISMVPSATWNAFHSLFVPLAVLLLGVQLTREERFKLLPWVLGLGLFSGFWGILQVVGDPQGSLYLYNATNNGLAVGLFANRNHQAMLLSTLFPMLAVFVSISVMSEEQTRFRTFVAIAVGGALVPLLFVTGSRAGLIVGTIGLLSVPLIYQKQTHTNARKRINTSLNLRWMLAGFAVLCLGALSILASRAEAWQRLLASNESDDRLLVWKPIVQMAWKYFPVGSGVGSFVEVYQIDETHDWLSTTYYNHAHNDWLESSMTLGLPGLFLLGLALLAWAWVGLGLRVKAKLEGRSVAYSRLGAVIILILALGSIGDYPLRAPSLACVFVIAALWMAAESSRSRKSGGSLERAGLRDVHSV